MSGFKKRPANGENPGGFRAILPGQAGGGGRSRDPTQGPPSGSRGGGGMFGPLNGGRGENPNGGDRWGSVDRGAEDNSGAEHDW